MYDGLAKMCYHYFAEYEKYRGELGNVRKGVLVCTVLSVVFQLVKVILVMIYT